MLWAVQGRSPDWQDCGTRQHQCSLFGAKSEHHSVKKQHLIGLKGFLPLDLWPSGSGRQTLLNPSLPSLSSPLLSAGWMILGLIVSLLLNFFCLVYFYHFCCGGAGLLCFLLLICLWVAAWENPSHCNILTFLLYSSYYCSLFLNWNVTLLHGSFYYK